MSAAPQAEAMCGQCGITLPPLALSCSGCSALVHAEKLEQLAHEARAASDRSDPGRAHAIWKQVLELLPPESVQHRSIQNRIAELVKQLPHAEPSAPQKAPQTPMARWAARLGPVGVFLWKAKLIVLTVLSKGKLVLLGLTKLTTLTTMIASMGLYWTLYGWKFALGLVLSIYIHEMGHVLELRRFGIAASAPMFIPGFGAVVMLKQRPATVGQDARVGLAGPVWGLAAAGFAFAMFLLTRAPIWAVLARFGAWINLFNLIPVWQLDGGRGFAALTRANRGVILGVALLMWLLTNDGVLFLVALGAGYRLFTRDYAPAPDAPVLQRFVVLLVLLAMLCLISLPGKPA
jgi:Zn-dependent protease